jgi:hypothetical protein
MAKCIGRQRNWYYFFYIMGGKGGQLEGEEGRLAGNAHLVTLSFLGY